MENDGGDYARSGPHVVGSIPHYHGDIVRQLFIVAAAVMLLTAPFYGDMLKIELPFEVIGALILVALGALINPHSKSVIYANAIAAGVGLVIYEVWALYGYNDGTWMQFLLRELIAVVFLVAFYFSMKTVRAYVLHQIGKREPSDEFENGNEKGSLDPFSKVITEVKRFTSWDEGESEAGHHRKSIKLNCEIDENGVPVGKTKDD